MTQNLNEYNIGENSPQTLLFVGDSGTGKSIAAADWKFPNDPRNIYFASCDGRMGSVAEWHRGRKDIEFDIFSDYEALDDKIESLIQDCPYQSLVIDPLTNVSSFLMRYSFSLRGVLEFNETTGKVERISKGRKKGKVDLTSFDDIAVEHRGIEDLLLNLKLISKRHNTNIILTAHLLTTTYTKVGGQESNIRRDIVTAGKKIVPFIPTQFDEYYHFYTENGKWMIKTYNDGIVPARSSFLLIPKEIDWTKRNLYELVSQYYIKGEE